MPLREAVERSDANSTLALAFSADDTTLYVGGAANGLVQVWGPRGEARSGVGNLGASSVHLALRSWVSAAAAHGS